jgi:hypothetical protein
LTTAEEDPVVIAEIIPIQSTSPREERRKIGGTVMTAVVFHATNASEIPKTVHLVPPLRWLRIKSANFSRAFQAGKLMSLHI